jgi:3-carboxy-cis,cis-muconate cycloisomerase
LPPDEPVSSPDDESSPEPSAPGLTPAGGLFDSIFTTDAMAGATSDGAWLRAMLDFESALASAEGGLGLVPAHAAESIVTACHDDRFDPVAIGRAGRLGANPAIPLVDELRRRVPGDCAPWVHFGSTSQDVLDSALMLVIGRATDLVVDHLDDLASAAATLAQRHRSTPMAARTLLQQALPTTFGAKASGWLVATLEAAETVHRARQRCKVVQLGGAAGTLASLGDSGPRVVEAVAAELGLGVAVMPWHSDRTRVVEMACALAMATGVAGKISSDVALLMQTEVGEAFEPAAAGRGGSSALPQKRNPAMAAVVGAAVRRTNGLAGVILGCMVQEHERAVGAWQAEWQAMTGLLQSTGGALSTTAEMLAGLDVDARRMASNLDITRGLVLSERVTLELSRHLGPAEARRVVEQASRRVAASTRSLRDELEADPATAALWPELPDDLFDPKAWLGSAEIFVDRALAAYAGAPRAGGSAP